jgi:hypothetical protein
MLLLNGCIQAFQYFTVLLGINGLSMFFKLQCKRSLMIKEKGHDFAGRFLSLELFVHRRLWMLPLHAFSLKFWFVMVMPHFITNSDLL